MSVLVILILGVALGLAFLVKPHPAKIVAMVFGIVGGLLSVPLLYGVPGSIGIVGGGLTPKKPGIGGIMMAVSGVSHIGLVFLRPFVFGKMCCMTAGLFALYCYAASFFLKVGGILALIARHRSLQAG